MVVWLIDGVTNGEPVALAVPPLAATYQLSVPPSQPVAVRLTVPVPQRAPGPATGADGVGGCALIVMHACNEEHIEDAVPIAIIQCCPGARPTYPPAGYGAEVAPSRLKV